MTRKQKECLDFIRAYTKIKGFCPTKSIVRYALEHANMRETEALLKQLASRVQILCAPSGISIFQEISRGPDGILKYAKWPTA